MTRRSFTEAATVTDEAAEIIDTVLDVVQETEEEIEVETQQEEAGATATALATVEVSTNAGLARSLRGIADTLETGVQQAIEQQYPDATPLEKRAMIAVECLRQTGSLDLVHLLMRARYLRQIQSEGLIAAHPAHYTSLNDMAAQNGMVVSEISFILDFVNIIVPYVQNTLGIPVGEFFNTLGKSKIKEMMGPLKALINGDRPDHPDTRTAVENLITDALNGMQVAPTEEEQEVMAQANNPEATEEQRQEAQQTILTHARRRAARELIDLAEHLPVAEMRQHLRPNGAEPIQMSVINGPEGQYLVARLTSDQAAIVQRRLRNTIQVQQIELPPDQNQWQTALFRFGPIRTFYETYLAPRRRR